MKRLLHFVWVLAALGLMHVPSGARADSGGKNKAPLIITPAHLKAKVSKTYTLKVKCTAEKNAQVEGESVFKIEPEELGSFDQNVFTALTEGKGSIITAYKDYTDSIDVEVVACPECIADSTGVSGDSTHVNTDSSGHGKGKNNKYPKITFETKGMVKLEVGQQTKVEATYWTSKKELEEVSFTYALAPGMLGSVSEEGMFNAVNPGKGEILVSYNEVSASLKVMVSQTDGKHRHNMRNVPGVQIVTRKVNLRVGEYVELMAVYVDSSKNETPCSPAWSVSDSLLGHFSDSLFIADSSGKGYILATYLSDTDSIPFHIRTPGDSVDFWSNFRIVIQPNDTALIVGDSLQFELAVQNKRNHFFDSIPGLSDSIQIEWSLVGHQVGELSESGLFLATKPGFGIIKAILNNEKAISTSIHVNETINDSLMLNQVEISRVLPNGNVLPSKVLSEGGTFKLGGLPYPLNLLNGGLLHFPVNSIQEDLHIYMMLPEQIKEDSTGVAMADSVISGVKFIVTVNDSVVEPYYFDIPLTLSIPYRQDLLDSMGLTPNDLGLFFALDSTYTESGIVNVVLDTVQNRILADVEHFSSFVIKQVFNADNVTIAEKHLTKILNLKSMPNPFTNSTRIAFTLDESSDVQVVIYDMRGKMVKNYHFNSMEEGNQTVEWDATTNNGGNAKPGLYIGSITTNGTIRGIVKMIKLGM